MPEPYGITLFCDDIRHEMGGKVSYMGVYGNDMVISGMTSLVLPKICIASTINIPSKPGQVHYLKMAVYHLVAQEDPVEIASVEGELEMPTSLPDEEITEDAYIKAILHLNISPFAIDGPCTLNVCAYLNGGEEIKVGKLPIRFVQGTATEMQDAS